MSCSTKSALMDHASPLRLAWLVPPMKSTRRASIDSGTHTTPPSSAPSPLDDMIRSRSRLHARDVLPTACAAQRKRSHLCPRALTLPLTPAEPSRTRSADPVSDARLAKRAPFGKNRCVSRRRAHCSPPAPSPPPPPLPFHPHALRTCSGGCDHRGTTRELRSGDSMSQCLRAAFAPQTQRSHPPPPTLVPLQTQSQAPQCALALRSHARTTPSLAALPTSPQSPPSPCRTCLSLSHQSSALLEPRPRRRGRVAS
jgi:hypothetical protein